MADFALLLKRSTRYEAALKEAGFTVACAAVLEFAAINASVLAEVSVLILFSFSRSSDGSNTSNTFHDIRSVPCLIIQYIAADLSSPLLPTQHASRPRSFRGVVLTSARAVEAIAAAIDAIDDGDTAAQWHAGACTIFSFVLSLNSNH